MMQIQAVTKRGLFGDLRYFGGLIGLTIGNYNELLQYKDPYQPASKVECSKGLEHYSKCQTRGEYIMNLLEWSNCPTLPRGLTGYIS